MNKRPAYEEIRLSHAGNSVRLRPSLRAATILEDKFGLAAIDRRLAELDLIVISEIILAASSSRREAAAFLSSLSGRPLSPFFEAVNAPLSDLARMFVPAPGQRSDKAQASGERMTFAEMFASLYDVATGWLGWTPDEAWSATPTEINRAFQAHMEKLKAIHGNDEADKKPSLKAHDPEQAARNIAENLDPEFDRAGLRALKAKISGGV